MIDKATSKRFELTRLLEAPIASLRYVSGTRLSEFKKLGIHTVRDLLSFYPFRYNDFSQVVSIACAPIGVRSCVQGTVDEVDVRSTRNRCRIVEISLIDDSGVMKAVWFNQPWIAQTLKKGTRVFLQGTVDHAFGFRQMSSPLYSIISDEMLAQSIIPVYHATASLTTAWIMRIQREACHIAADCIDPLPVRLRMRNNLIARGRALVAVHAPRSKAQIAAAQDRLRYEELFFLQLYMAYRRNIEDHEHQGKAQQCSDDTLARYYATLPFVLTSDQREALEEIRIDMASTRSMHRMLFGDVGSGKTAVAAGALCIAAASGYQAALMAPTEVLAYQYGENIGPVLESLDISWALLTSSTSTAERAQILSRLACGDLSVLFGTHALLEDDVRFADLTLVVIDEQHRFGVEQRARLVGKGPGCDQLYLTATPIPRSLALTLYGDMQTSFLNTAPAQRAGVTTRVLPKTDHFTAYEAVRAAVESGHQAYIICPLVAALAGDRFASVDQSDSVETDSEQLYAETSDDAPSQNLKAARREASYLQDQVFPDARVGLLCGSMKSADKLKVMRNFKEGLIDILVSTTVVEVGVDVLNATVMIIEDAEHFGLAQLHQLRGRVGRGKFPGTLFLMAQPQSDNARRRIVAMETTTNGFELSELDLSLRKEGDLVGYRQHGDSRLSFVNVIRDAALISRIHEDVTEILASDPLLEHSGGRHIRYELSVLFPEKN
jgi:ATP-dependent DNA helicase RecG